MTPRSLKDVIDGEREQAWIDLVAARVHASGGRMTEHHVRRSR
ncbi:MAG TPA: hypothetical protein VJ649_07870 [Actinomycetes bacterium]|nr:hypothetical protein [Actinomycetes bacterium]